MDWIFLNFLINKQIGILALSSPMLASETISLHIMSIILLNSLIVELNPSSIILLDVAEIVPELGTSVMKNNTS